jgi:opacity protein-like surface antigen
MRALILSATLLLLCNAAAPGATARQDEDAPRYLDAKLVPAEGRAAGDFVPRGWKLEGDEGELTGDLNKDGSPDKVLRLVEDLPLERPDGVYNTRYRALVVLLARPEGGFRRAAVATRLLGCTLCAGALGDPEGGNITLDITKGVLNVHQLSGAREATDLTQRFRYDDASGRFALVGQDMENYDRAEGGSESVSTNYLTGVRVSKKTKPTKRGADRVIYNRTTRVNTARRFIEDVDYEESFDQ